MQLREMLRAELCRLVRRVQRIGEQQERRGDIGRFGGEHARLTPAIGVAAEMKRSQHMLAQHRERVT